MSYPTNRCVCGQLSKRKETDAKRPYWSLASVRCQVADCGKPPLEVGEDVTVDKTGKYRIAQIQGKYDREHTFEMTKYVQQLLDEAQKQQ